MGMGKAIVAATMGTLVAGLVLLGGMFLIARSEIIDALADYAETHSDVPPAGTDDTADDERSDDDDKEKSDS